MGGSKRIHEPYMALKGKMREKGLKYADLAAVLGITPTTFSQKVNGKSDFTLSEAEMIKAHLGTDNFIFSESSCENDNVILTR